MSLSRDQKNWIKQELKEIKQLVNTNGDPKSVVDRCDAILALDKKNYLALLLKGKVVNSHRQRNQLFLKASRIQPNNPLAWRGMLEVAELALDSGRAAAVPKAKRLVPHLACRAARVAVENIMRLAGDQMASHSTVAVARSTLLAAARRGIAAASNILAAHSGQQRRSRPGIKQNVEEAKLCVASIAYHALLYTSGDKSVPTADRVAFVDQLACALTTANVALAEGFSLDDNDLLEKSPLWTCFQACRQADTLFRVLVCASVLASSAGEPRRSAQFERAALWRAANLILHPATARNQGNKNDDVEDNNNQGQEDQEEEGGDGDQEEVGEDEEEEEEEGSEENNDGDQDDFDDIEDQESKEKPNGDGGTREIVGELVQYLSNVSSLATQFERDLLLLLSENFGFQSGSGAAAPASSGNNTAGAHALEDALADIRLAVEALHQHGPGDRSFADRLAAAKVQFVLGSGEDDSGSSAHAQDPAKGKGKQRSRTPVLPLPRTPPTLLPRNDGPVSGLLVESWLAVLDWCAKPDSGPALLSRMVQSIKQLGRRAAFRRHWAVETDALCAERTSLELFVNFVATGKRLPTIDNLEPVCAVPSLRRLADCGAQLLLVDTLLDAADSDDDAGQQQHNKHELVGVVNRLLDSLSAPSDSVVFGAVTVRRGRAQLIGAQGSQRQEALQVMSAGVATCNDTLWQPLLWLGRASRSVDLLEKAVALNCHHAPLFSLLGHLYGAQDDVDKQRAMFEQAFALDPGCDNQRPAQFLVTEYRRRGLHDQALALISDAARRSVGTATRRVWWQELAYCCMEQKRFDDAIVHFQQLLRPSAGPSSSAPPPAAEQAALWLALGECYMETGRQIAAAKSFMAALRLWNRSVSLGGDAKMTELLTSANDAAAQPKDAGAHEQKPLSLAPECRPLVAYTHCRLAAACELMGGGTASAEQTGLALAVVPGFLPAVIGRGRALIRSAERLIQLGAMDRAVATLDGAIDDLSSAISELQQDQQQDTRGGPWVLWKTAGDACMALFFALPAVNADLSNGRRLNALTRAVSFYATALHQFPERGRAWADLANALQKQALVVAAAERASNQQQRPADGDQTDVSANELRQQALFCAREAIRRVPQSAALWNLAGVCATKDQPSLARHCFIRAVRCDVRYAAAWTNLGWLNWHRAAVSGTGEALARHCFEAARAARPHGPSAWVGLALIEEQSKQWWPANNLYAHADNLAADASASHVSDRAGVRLARLGMARTLVEGLANCPVPDTHSGKKKTPAKKSGPSKHKRQARSKQSEDKTPVDEGDADDVAAAGDNHPSENGAPTDIDSLCGLVFRTLSGLNTELVSVGLQDKGHNLIHAAIARLAGDSPPGTAAEPANLSSNKERVSNGTDATGGMTSKVNALRRPTTAAAASRLETTSQQQSNSVATWSAKVQSSSGKRETWLGLLNALLLARQWGRALCVITQLQAHGSVPNTAQGCLLAAAKIDCLIGLNRLDEAAAAAAAACVDDQLPGSNASEGWLVVRARARLAAAAGNHDEAVTLYRQCIDLQKKANVTLWHELAAVHHAHPARQVGAAQLCLMKALEFAASPVDVFRCHLRLAWWHFWQKQYDVPQALESAKKAAGSAKKECGSSPAAAAAAHLLYAVLLLRTGGDADVVLSELNQAIRLRPEAPGPRYFLAFVYMQLEELDKADFMLRSELRLLYAQLPPPPPPPGTSKAEPNFCKADKAMVASSLGLLSKIELSRAKAQRKGGAVHKQSPILETDDPPPASDNWQSLDAYPDASTDHLWARVRSTSQSDHGQLALLFSERSCQFEPEVIDHWREYEKVCKFMDCPIKLEKPKSKK